MSERPCALKLASVPIVDRGIGWQADATAALKAQDAEIESLRRDLDVAIGMLAAWCVSVDVNGTGWDDWDEHYKDAAYRPGPLRERLDAAIAEERSQRGEEA